MRKKLELGGLKFGKLRVIAENGRTKKKQVLWLCKCDCGKEITTAGYLLNNGYTKSCGCSRIEAKKGKPSPRRSVPPIGTFIKGMEIIGIDEPYSYKGGKALVVRLRCHCSKEFSCLWSNIKHHGQKSCGCLMHKKRGGPTTHELYPTWHDMKLRCYRKTAINYKYYGGRRIRVCREWKKDFYAFVNWAVLNGWRKGLQIDRIRNGKGYSPNNCRVVTPKMNMSNRRK